MLATNPFSDRLCPPRQPTGGRHVPHDPVAQSLSGHLPTVGLCRIVYGVIRLIMAVCMVTYVGTATVMFALCSIAFLTR
jgi:hypothetical protein